VVEMPVECVLQKPLEQVPGLRDLGGGKGDEYQESLVMALLECLHLCHELFVYPSYQRFSPIVGIASLKKLFG
jgi:hypothetical protein